MMYRSVPVTPNLYPDVSRRENGKKLSSVIKRIVDVVGSILGLILVAPLFLVIALAFGFLPRAPCFSSVRVGRDGAPFVFLKFRSMHLDNDTHVHKQYVTQLIAGEAEPQTPVWQYKAYTS